jgi:hypothetical protein
MNAADRDGWMAKLANLKELLKLGVINQGEFEKRKQQLVDNMTGTKLDQPTPTKPPRHPASSSDRPEYTALHCF